MLKKISLLLSFFLVSQISLYAEDADDLSLEDMLDMETELTAEVGSRSGAKSLLNSVSPTDVITYQQIDDSGLTSLVDVLRYFIAGFNAPETSIADGSDHVRAITLRGMSPDQILVLINGKRRHTSALLHVNDTIGKGASNVDLDAIALRSIEKIEILRDGAAAQYGSDAISGVINIILKGANHKNQISVHSGERKKGDGLQLNSDLFVSKSLKYDGFVNLAVQVKKQEQTQRAGKDRRTNAPAFNSHVGIPDSKNILTALNAEIPLENTIVIYTNTLVSYRDSEASTFSRETNATYPKGFLPILRAKLLDTSLTVGFKGEVGDGYYYDISNVYGRSTIDYSLRDTVNYSLINSPSSFNNGSLTFMQNTTNTDIRKSTDMVELAFGAEYRLEGYKIKAGEFSSYTNGGSQGFSGYRPENAVDASRHSYALYFEGKSDILDNLSATLATRYEDYSDFGNTLNVKLALGYEASKKLFFRTSASTGFRAPSLAQSHYSHTSTFGGLVEGLYKPSDSEAKIFGAKELKPESSQHFTLGSVYTLNTNTHFMIDYFFVQNRDKIGVSQDFNATGKIAGVQNVRFFINSGETQTQGVDIKINHEQTFEDDSNINLSIWYNYSQNKVTDTKGVPRASYAAPISRIENGQPKDSLRFLTKYTIKNISSSVNISKYGSYEEYMYGKNYRFESAWTVDMDISYLLDNVWKIALGGINLFDTIPNKWDGLSGEKYGYDGIKPYSRYSPFGYSGAYYYVRASLDF